MDDRKFDEKSATEWTSLIESEGAKIRETYLYPVLCDWLLENHVNSVLDVGCGQGICSMHLPPTIQYSGIDPSPFLIERAKNFYPAKEFNLGSIYSLPFKESSFDAFFSIAVFHLLENPQKAAEECARILHQKGHFWILTADPEQKEAWTSSDPGTWNGIRFDGNDVLYFHSVKSLKESLSKAALKVEKVSVLRQFIVLQGIKR